MSDTTAYGPTPVVTAQDQLAPVLTLKEYHTIDYANASGSDIVLGGVVVVNGMPMVAVEGIPNGKSGTLTFLMGGNGLKDNSVWAIGEPVYWNPTGSSLAGTAGAGCLTSVAGGAYFAGFAAVAALTGDTRVQFQLRPVTTATAISIVNQMTNAIADPGNVAHAIPVTNGGYVDIVTAGAETRTLAAPSFKGQMLLISFKTDGGDCVITCATTINQTGNNTITLNDAGDAVLLVAKTNGANIRWSVVVNDGAALATA